MTESQARVALVDAEPLTVKEAARFLGVSRQTVYAWVERPQIPHLRVMGRNIRFLQSDLTAFRAGFKREVENRRANEGGEVLIHDGRVRAGF